MDSNRPVFIYDNLDNEDIKKQIAQETKGLSGVYLILNKETLAFYVGSASTNRFNSRFTNHLLYLNGSKIIKNSVKKYKLYNFCFMILELFPEVVTQQNTTWFTMTWVTTDQLVSRLSTFYGLDDHGWASHNLDERGVSRGTPLGLMMPRQNISSAWILRFEKKHRRSYACHARIVLHLYFHCIVFMQTCVSWEL